MELISIVTSVLLASVAAWYLLKPHIQRVSDRAVSTNQNVSGLLDHKERVLQILKDLELDYSTGKVAAEDYQRTRELLRGEAAAVLEKIDAISKK